MFIDLYFPVCGEQLPTDHGYAIFSGSSRPVPTIHDKDANLFIGPILGNYVGNGLLRLDANRSRLRLRLPAEQIPIYLPLAGKALNIDGHKIRLGVPQVRALIPAPSLIARLVVIKGFTEPGPFLDACRRQLDTLGIAGEAGIPLVPTGPHSGKPRRHIMRIKDKKVVGFSVQITGLTAEESIKLQEHGLGGRKKMGCGFFVPFKERD